MLRPVSDYCDQTVEGWVRLPADWLFANPGEEHLTCGFVNEAEGMQLIATVKQFVADRLTGTAVKAEEFERVGHLMDAASFKLIGVIHVSIGQVRTFRPDLTEEQLAQNIEDQTPEILYAFFGDRGFSHQPDDPRRPTLKHHFSVLEEEDGGS